MTTITTRAGKGAELTYQELDDNFTNLNDDKLELSGGVLTGNIEFANSGEGIVFSDNTSITSAAGISGTTYSVSAETATGGANVRLTGSDTSTDDVKLAEGTGITVTRTDANVITVATTALLNVVEDLTPQLGGNLDAMNYTISNVDVVSTDGVQLDTTANEAGAVGKLVWDDGEGGINYTAKGGNLDVTIGETNFALVHNGEATTLTKGTVVYAFGAQGNRISVKRAQANVDATSARTLGLVAESIASGAEGFVITSGTLKNINTTGLTEGGIIYLSAATAGAYTQTKPYAPDHLVYLGVVTRAHTSGRIDVKIQNGYELEEIHDVNINHNVAIADDHYLIYNSSNDLWENGPLDISDDATPNLGGNLDAMNYNISNVDVVSTDAVQLDTAAAEANAVGKIYWNANRETVSMGLNDIILNTGQHNVLYGKASQTINKGQVVMYGGVQGDHILFKLADDDAAGFIPEWVFGIAAENFSTNSFGFVTILGEVTDINTNSFNEGDLVYYDPTTTGGLTATRPSSPAPKIIIGAVTKKNASTGIIAVRVAFKGDLEDLDNVNGGPSADNDFLRYESSTGSWTSEPLDISYDTSPNLGGNLDTGNFTIASTTGALQLADAAVTVGDGTQATVINGAGAYDLTITTNNTTIANTAPYMVFGHGAIPSGTGITSAADDGTIAFGGNINVRGGILHNTLTTTGASAAAGVIKMRAYPFSDGTNFGGDGHATATNYRDPTTSSTIGACVVFGTQGNVAVQSRESDTGTSTWASVRNGFQVHATETMRNSDRWRGQAAGLDVALNTFTWGTLSTASRNAPVLVGQQGACTAGTSGSVSHMVGQSGIVAVNPAASSTINVQYGTGQFVSMGITGQGTGAVANITNARLLGGSLFSGNTSITGHTITNAMGLHITDGWATVTGVTITNKYAVLNEDSGSKIQTNGNLDVTGTTTVGTLNTGNVTTTGNISVSAVMTVGNYASGSLPSGAVGSIIAINNNGGKLAYWDTTNSRWSYVADDSAV